MTLSHGTSFSQKEDYGYSNMTALQLGSLGHVESCGPGYFIFQGSALFLTHMLHAALTGLTRKLAFSDFITLLFRKYKVEETVV